MSRLHKTSFHLYLTFIVALERCLNEIKQLAAVLTIETAVQTFDPALYKYGSEDLQNTNVRDSLNNRATLFETFPYAAKGSRMIQEFCSPCYYRNDRNSEMFNVMKEMFNIDENKSKFIQHICSTKV